MIELKPNRFNNFICPECSNKNIRVDDIIFQGIHVLADCICLNCNLEFLHTFPVGHSLYYPTVLEKRKLKIYSTSKSNVDWLTKPLLKSFLSPNKAKVKFNRIKLKEVKEIILLNCLDSYYGHVLLKLLNAQDYIENYKNLGIVIIIPKNFEWLLPSGIAEAWIVDIKLKNTDQRFVEIDKFIKNEITRFEKIFLGLAFSHPDPARINISQFTKTLRFDLSKFESSDPCISFIWREDRLWFNNIVENLVYKILRKVNLLFLFNQFFLFRQNELIINLAKLIKKDLPNLTFQIVGLGRKMACPNYVLDKRENTVTDSTEKEWCELYARSHLAIGIHGSNMLIPTALAAGFIEILPKDRLGNFFQDILSSYSNRELIYFCRFVAENSTSKEIAQIANNIIKNYPNFKKTMTKNYLKHQLYTDLSKWKS